MMSALRRQRRALESNKPMVTPVEWIAEHALAVWVLLLLLAVLAGDLAWRHNARFHRHAVASGQPAVLLRKRMALALLLILAALFAALAFAVTLENPGRVALFDTALADGLRSHLSPAALRVIAGITHLGDLWWIAPLAALIAVALWWLRHRRLAVAWSAALVGILPINGGLKMLFQRVRPLHEHGFIVEPGWSFPSGHAFGSMVIYGMLAYVLVRLLPQRFHRAVIAAAVVLAGMVGTSRILLHVHYFSDVVAGYAAGAAWLVLCIGVAEYLRTPSSGRTQGPPHE